jgi:penicillin-binding protein 1A
LFTFRNIFKLFSTLFFILSVILAAFYLNMKSELPSVESLKGIQWQTPMQIYSSDNKLISQFGQKRRIPLTFEDTPQQLINALLATEDDRFYLHFGVDPIGMGRAILGKLMGENKGGASTITMQVARNFFLTREQTYTRKLREIFLSFHIESLLTKNEILSLYINKIELGHRAFGFGAAAQVYYGKNIDELTLAQIAVLAGLPKAPSTLNPIRSKTRAKARRAVVLHRMLVSGYITNEAFNEAIESPITGQRHGAKIELNAPYIAEMAHKKVVDLYGKERAYTEGYKIFTTVGSQLQLAAQDALVQNLYRYDQRHGYRGAIKNLLGNTPEGRAKRKLKESTNTVVLKDDDIATAISQTAHYQNLLPAVVTRIDVKAVNITLANNAQSEILWPGMSWARAFINDDKQGPAPVTASDVLSVGDLIFVTLNADNSYQLNQLPEVSAALVSISPDDGAIKAAVGGFSFNHSQYNRVTQAHRQVGSNIKPFIYSAALKSGLTLASLVNDAPINQWDRSTGVVWRPKNSPEVYAGPIRVRLALAQSKNVIAVRLLRSVGLNEIIDHLSLFGFSPDELPHNESLALGSASLTPLELATGFATFANGGFLVEPYFIERIENSVGEVIYKADPLWACDPCQESNKQSMTGSAIQENSNYLPTDLELDGELVTFSFTGSIQQEKIVRQAPRVITEQNAFLVTQALNSAIWGGDWNTQPHWQGTGFRARTLKRKDIAGKTGTTNQSKDAWFSGYSRRLATTSWIGFDDHQRNLGKTSRHVHAGKNQITGTEFGAKSAQPAWIDYMEEALTTVEVESFRQPEGIVSVRIDKASGKLTRSANKDTQFEFFRAEYVPTDYVSEEASQVTQESEVNIFEDELF